MPLSRFKPISPRATFLRALMIAAVAGLFFWAWRGVSLAAVSAAIGRWGWIQWLLFVALNLLILGAMCWRWSLILRRMGYRVGFVELVRYRMAANTLSYITPGPQFGGEPLQVHCLVTRHQVPSEAASASVAVDRLMELMGNLLFLSLCGFFVLPPLMEDSAAMLPVTAVMSAAVLVIGVLLFIIATGRAPLSWLSGLAVRCIGWQNGTAGLVSYLRACERQVSRILTDRLFGWYAFGSLLQWSVFLAELWMIYGFMGSPMNTSALLTVAVAGRLAFMLPLPGGLGGLEASQMLALTSLGGDPTLAVAACCIMRARDLVLISIGAGLAIRWIRAPYGEKPHRPLGNA